MPRHGLLTRDKRRLGNLSFQHYEYRQARWQGKAREGYARTVRQAITNEIEQGSAGHREGKDLGCEILRESRQELRPQKQKRGKPDSQKKARHEYNEHGDVQVDDELRIRHGPVSNGARADQSPQETMPFLHREKIRPSIARNGHDHHTGAQGNGRQRGDRLDSSCVIDGGVVDQRGVKTRPK